MRSFIYLRDLLKTYFAPSRLFDVDVVAALVGGWWWVVGVFFFVLFFHSLWVAALRRSDTCEGKAMRNDWYVGVSDER